MKVAGKKGPDVPASQRLGQGPRTRAAGQPHTSPAGEIKSTYERERAAPKRGPLGCRGRPAGGLGCAPAPGPSAAAAGSRLPHHLGGAPCQGLALPPPGVGERRAAPVTWRGKEGRRRRAPAEGAPGPRSGVPAPRSGQSSQARAARSARVEPPLPRASSRFGSLRALNRPETRGLKS